MIVVVCGQGDGADVSTPEDLSTLSTWAQQPGVQLSWEALELLTLLIPRLPCALGASVCPLLFQELSPQTSSLLT